MRSHLQDGKRGINRKNLSSNDITAAKAWNDSELVGKRKDNKRVFIVGDGIIKHLNGYVIGGKTGNCNVYVRPTHGAKVRCMIDHVKPIIRDKPDHIIFHVGTNDISSDKDAGDIAKSIVDLTMSAKSLICDVSISNIITIGDCDVSISNIIAIGDKHVSISNIITIGDCDVPISNIITIGDKHQHKAQIVNNHLKEMCTNKNINLIDHSKNIKHQHLIL